MCASLGGDNALCNVWSGEPRELEVLSRNWCCLRACALIEASGPHIDNAKHLVGGSSKKKSTSCLSKEPRIKAVGFIKKPAWKSVPLWNAVQYQGAETSSCRAAEA